MREDLLFSKHDLRLVIENQRAALRDELDKMPDSRLLNTDASALKAYLFDKWCINLPVLGQPVVDESRTKIEVGRYGGFVGFDEPGVQVDAHRYTLEIPFTGDKDLFYCQGSTMNFNPPRGTVRDGLLVSTLVEREPTADKINQYFDRFLADLNQHLGWLKGDIDAWNKAISPEVDQILQYRREKAERAGSVASGLKFSIKQRSDTATTYAATVLQKKRVAAQLPPASPGAPPEPTLGDEIYRTILDTLKQMAIVMERSPHAYAKMDEETLRFQFLIPLNANFEGDARAEVFNYGGKTDILITEKGKNLFVAECKFWRGAQSLAETVDQILGYLAWRDTKCAILLFNKNRNFSQVLSQIVPTLSTHNQFVSYDGNNGETEMLFTFRRADDPDRRLKLTVLSFDIPIPDAP